MHVAVIGAGSLGRVYGVHLATSGVPTSFVVRPKRADEQSPFAIERSGGDRRRRILEHPVRVSAVPDDATVMLLAVRVDQIDAALEATLRAAPPVPLVSLTPLLPRSQDRVDALVGGRLLVGMPVVAGTLDHDDVVRYALPPFGATLIESSRGIPSGAESLVRALSRSGLPTRFARGVSRKNPATTVAFFPLSASLGLAGGVEQLVADRALLRIAIGACRESLQVARRLGPVDKVAGAIARLAGPAALAAVVASTARLAPGAIAYLDEHFGRKLLDQHRAMGREILALAREHDVATPTLAALLQRLDGSDA